MVVSAKEKGKKEKKKVASLSCFVLLCSALLLLCSALLLFCYALLLLCSTLLFALFCFVLFCVVFVLFYKLVSTGVSTPASADARAHRPAIQNSAFFFFLRLSGVSESTSGEVRKKNILANR
jgi:fatty acid desaturase